MTVKKIDTDLAHLVWYEAGKLQKDFVEVISLRPYDEKEDDILAGED